MDAREINQFQDHKYKITIKYSNLHMEHDNIGRRGLLNACRAEQ